MGWQTRRAISNAGQRTDKILDPPFCWFPKKGNRWATPKSTDTIVAAVLSCRAALNCNSSEHSLLKYLYPKCFVKIALLVLDAQFNNSPENILCQYEYDILATLLTSGSCVQCERVRSGFTHRPADPAVFTASALTPRRTHWFLSHLCRVISHIQRLVGGE